jgi:hypothetical protein
LFERAIGKPNARVPVFVISEQDNLVQFDPVIGTVGTSGRYESSHLDRAGSYAAWGG